jgi:hypothetical protein
VDIDRRYILQAHEENLGLLRKLKECLDTGYFGDASEERDLYEYREVDIEVEEDLSEQYLGEDTL